MTQSERERGPSGIGGRFGRKRGSEEEPYRGIEWGYSVKVSQCNSVVSQSSGEREMGARSFVQRGIGSKGELTWSPLMAMAVRPGS